MIIILDGEDGDAKRLIGNSLRNTQINEGKGALLIHADDEGAPAHLLEKIIAGHPFTDGSDIRKIHWKKEPAIIVASEREDMLDLFESMVPGFLDRFGPISRTTVAPKKGLWASLFGG